MSSLFIYFIFNLPESDNQQVKAFGFAEAWFVSLRRALRTLLPVCFLSSVLCVFCHSQVINNACATQAIVSVLLNCSHSDMLLGDTLTEFREFSQSFDAAVRSRYIFWILNCLSVWVVHLFRFMLGCALAVEFRRPSATCFYGCFPHYHKKHNWSNRIIPPLKVQLKPSVEFQILTFSTEAKNEWIIILIIGK